MDYDALIQESEDRYFAGLNAMRERRAAADAKLLRAERRGRLAGKLLFWTLMSPLIAAIVAALSFTATLPR